MSAAYFEETDAAASVDSSEVLVIVKVNISQKPGVSELSTGAIELLITAQVSACEHKVRVHTFSIRNRLT